MELLGNAGAANDGAPLEHERLQAGSGQQAGRDETVVAGTDHDDVVDA
jgi:hypothetical protein